FDGRGYKITGLHINRPSTNDVGLFGYASGATIQNVGLVDGTIEGNQQTGGIVGQANSSTISHSYNTGSVTGSGDSNGGIVGFAGYNTTNSHSYNTGSVTGGGNHTGGIVGQGTFSTISQCYNIGSVIGIGSGWNTGGIAGRA